MSKMSRKVVAGVLASVSIFLGGNALAEDVKDAVPSLEFKPKLSGYIEAWYRNDNSDLSDQTTAAKKVDNEFRVRRARLTASGNLSPELGYKLTASLDGPSPGSSSATVKIWDAYISYTQSEFLKVIAGQIKYDFTIEGLESTSNRVPVLRAESIHDIAGKLGTKGGSFRDIGVKANGSFKSLLGLTYGVDVINGSGINTGDNNADKDVVGMVTLSPVENLLLSASWYMGKGQDETTPFEVKESAWSAGAEYAISGLKLRGEYIAARWKNWDVSTGTASLGKTQKPKGWYLQASYKLPPIPDLEVLGRYEDYQKDSNTVESHLKTTTMGLTYYLKGKTRLTANYLIRTADGSSIVTAQETDAAGRRIGNLFLLQAILVF